MGIVHQGIIALALAGCDSGKAKSDSKTGNTAGATSKAAKAESKLAKLKNLDVKAALPKGSMQSDAIGGKGVMLMGAAPVSITEAGKNDPKTLEAAKKDAADFKPTNVKTEKLSDGWLLTYDNKGSMGANYFLKMRRTVGGKDYVCSATASKPEQRVAGIKVCKSLTK